MRVTCQGTHKIADVDNHPLTHPFVYIGVVYTLTSITAMIINDHAVYVVNMPLLRFYCGHKKRPPGTGGLS
jgi:uncharacterized Zn-finger protein